jgi:hypothetical protein
MTNAREENAAEAAAEETRLKAREVLIDACVEDWLEAGRDDPDYARKIFRYGCEGFTNFDDKQLVTAVAEVGLLEDHGPVLDAAKLLDPDAFKD